MSSYTLSSLFYALMVGAIGITFFGLVGLLIWAEHDLHKTCIRAGGVMAGEVCVFHKGDRP